MKEQKIGILGYGEIGKSLAQFYKNPKIKDLNRDDGLAGVDVLHVCIPFDEKFVGIIKKEIKEIRPSLTIIHSTVELGTIKKIGGMVVHSPVRGTHPNLYKGIKTFVKYIGADDKKAGQAAKKHLESLGIKTKLFFPSKTTEALKLWETTQYGWFIVLNKEIKKWCDKNGVDFEKVYTDSNMSYDEGYKKLGRPEVLRPYLKYIPGVIGGHCVVPNCKILKSEISELILRKNLAYAKKNGR
jgi:hypothetical protein